MSRVYGTPIERARRVPCPGVGAEVAAPLSGDTDVVCPVCECYARYRKSDGTVGTHTTTPRKVAAHLRSVR